MAQSRRCGPRERPQKLVLVLRHSPLNTWRHNRTLVHAMLYSSYGAAQRAEARNSYLGRIWR